MSVPTGNARTTVAMQRTAWIVAAVVMGLVLSCLGFGVIAGVAFGLGGGLALHWILWS